MIETRHVRLDYEEALTAKKELLNSEMNLLKIGKKLKIYRDLRKKELTEKGKFKTSLGILKKRINLILSTFPKEKVNIEEEKEIQVKKEEGDFHKELDEIKKKLKMLER